MHGLLILDKPAGVTSHDALDPVKRAVGRRVRVGHAGTLDPFATGVLLALVGDGTRLAEIATAFPKSYDAVVVFGRETDTLDPDGETVAEADPGDAPPAAIDAVLECFRGEIEQMPPAYSALKVRGQRAHELARRGEEVPLEARRVVVHELTVTEIEWPRARLRVRCGAGTYVRALARDLGAALGLPAGLETLRRTAVGPFAAGDAIALAPNAEPRAEDLAGRLRPLVQLTRAASLPEIRLDAERAMWFANGRRVEPPGGAAPTEGVRIAVLLPDGETLLGLGQADADGLLRPLNVLASAT
jgi:tRNA pseudouridine55 synthase